ncbi:bifunctional pyr operon transcriptional regulator/uracil phosphoribosyltransferase PyrR [Motiliproteus sediminis]|uniref:bifunctional pyr operon transcriptional regulator/uracil phosphoribosyltransferase PyrR n=1 Tax=Motiliproteus sediminis TaxID=1468178 RepID=UPI001AEF6D29|nr:bifunctional pyr operon transcriptional regulator/uracil phosphoribosyltransferase PyrR [Motiliproteus sediminis]
MQLEINVDAVLNRMGEELAAQLSQRGISRPMLVGIRSGGVWLAERLHRQLGISDPLGVLDISFYRDDFTRVGLNPKVQPSALPFATEGQHIVLVDDVLMTGRTVRAALNELFDFGRPASVSLVALVDLNARELPIRADIIGETLSLQPGQQVKLNGPDNLILELQDKA